MHLRSASVDEDDVAVSPASPVEDASVVLEELEASARPLDVASAPVTAIVEELVSAVPVPVPASLSEPSGGGMKQLAATDRVKHVPRVILTGFT
ncbi:MAG: hypothetical protein ACRBN8_40145 [Nannocystales bacterium]